MPQTAMNDGSSVTDTDEVSTIRGDEDSRSVVEVAPSSSVVDSPAGAYTIACNGPNCEIEVFGNIKLYPTSCCNYSVCELCLARARREGSRCPIPSCRRPLENAGSLFLSDDPSEVVSKERDIRRTAMLNENPRYKEVVEDGRLLEAKAASQKEQIEEHSRMHSVLADQIVQSGNRVEAVMRETDACKDMVQLLVNRTQKVQASNDALRKEIDAVRAKKSVIASRIASASESG